MVRYFIPLAAGASQALLPALEVAAFRTPIHDIGSGL